MLLPDVLRESAVRLPEKWAAISCDQRITFRDLDQRSNQVAARLRRLGVVPGDRVALVYENSLDALVCFWGVLKSGAVTVDIPFQAAPKVTREVLQECKPKVLVIHPKVFPQLAGDGAAAAVPRIILGARESESSARERNLHFHSFEEIYQAEDRRPVRADGSERDVAMIIYTSGTTGRPKGVMLSHRNLISNVASLNELMGLTSEDSILIAVPFHFIHGRLQILTHALTGGTIVLSAGFQFPTVVVDELARHEVSGFSGVPYHYITLLRRTRLKSTPLPRLKYVVVTGGALSQSALADLRDAIPGIDIHIGYGQTEASPRITCLLPHEVFVKKGSVGRAMPGVEVEVVDDGGNPLARGETGEVVVSGPNVMRGYVCGDERSSGTIDDRGRLHTGDLGWLDREGYLYLAGRKSEMIKTAGERIFPPEIEDVVNTHPAVRESAIIGVTDEVLGERIVAFVALEKGQSLSLADLRNHCLKAMPFVRVPRELLVIDAVPKTPSGKVSRNELRRLYDGAVAH
jgi:long-chain acyl-CoA synthetase